MSRPVNPTGTNGHGSAMAKCLYNYSRDLGQERFSDEDNDCALPATYHVLWSDNSASVACEAHARMARGFPFYQASHPLSALCVWWKSTCFTTTTEPAPDGH